jgi:hypothetical protein
VVSASPKARESARVARADANRIVLAIAHTSETTTVLAPVSVESSPTVAMLGSTLTATTIARLPSAHMHARDSLPLLPSVIRGADGLMQLGGARKYQTPITLDGFNVTDPATGLSSLNLPLEAVKGIDACAIPWRDLRWTGRWINQNRQPLGRSTFAKGVQGFVPRPRFSTPGFGRLEGIFPRAFASGSAASGRIQYVAAGEYDYERIPVPEVTDRTGHDLVDESAIMFTRVDARLSSRSTVTVEAFSFPARTRSFGEPAAVSNSCRSLGVSRASSTVLSPGAGVFAVRLGAVRARRWRRRRRGSLINAGDQWKLVFRGLVWRGVSAAATWDGGSGSRVGLTVTATVDGASLAQWTGDEQPIVVTNAGAPSLIGPFSPHLERIRDIRLASLQTCGMSAADPIEWRQVTV